MVTDLSKKGTAMKKIFNSLMILAAAAATFASCSKEVDTQENVTPGQKMKTITVKTDIETRTTLDANHENIIWSANDKISIFNNVDNTNLLATYAAGTDLTIEVPETTEEIYAHYPYYDGNTTGPKSASVYITDSQTQKNPGELNGYNYPMVAKGTVSADNKALISLYPVASALALNIYHTGLEGEESVKSVTVTPAAANTKFIGRQVTDLTGNSITYTEAAESDPITVTLTNAWALRNTKPSDMQKFEGQIYVCLAKQSYANVRFDIETTKGTYTITSNATPFDCVNNDFVPVNINLAKADFEAFETAVDPTAFSWSLVKDALAVGDKVVIAAAESAVAMSTEQKSNNRGQIKITKSGNALTANADVQVFEVMAGSASSSFAFKCLNGDQIRKYIAAVSSSSNNMHSNSEIDANASWSVSITAATGVASVVAQGSYTRNTIRYNSSSSLFSCYAADNNMADVVFYRAGLPAAELSFPEASYSVDLGDTFTAPALNNPGNVTVTYSSSDTDVATVDPSTGAVTIVAAGTTTITASFAGNSTYSANDASYELVVVDSSTLAGWVETAISALSTGDVVVIVEKNKAKAMSNNNGTSNAPAATSVTIGTDANNNSILTGTIPATIQWTFETSTNGYRFKTGDDYLYTTNTNNGVRVGSNEANVFSIKDNYLYNDATSRYLGVYNDQDWRCYTSINSNISGQTLAFYKNYGGSTPTPTTYSLTIADGITNGSVVASKSSDIAEGESITLTVTPDSNYELETLTVDGADVTASVTSKGEYTFSMPGHNVTVIASFAPVGDAPAKVVYDFTGSDWSVSNGTLTDGTVSFTGAGKDNFKMNDGYFFMGKSGAYINFPAYSDPVTKIVVTGRSGASGSVKQNIYVGDTAVSTETTGATGTNTYEINSSYQAAGTIYTLKVTSAHNTQITKIEVFF